MQIIINAPVVMSAMGIPQDTINGYTVAIEGAPELTGTEKQVSWANKIRDAAIEDMARSGLGRVKDADGISLASARYRSDVWQAALDGLNARLSGYADRLATIISAKDWIEADNSKPSIDTIIALLR